MTHSHIPFNMLISSMYYSNMQMRLRWKTDFLTQVFPPSLQGGVGGSSQTCKGIRVQPPLLKFSCPKKVFPPRLILRSCFSEKRTQARQYKTCPSPPRFQPGPRIVQASLLRASNFRKKKKKEQCFFFFFFMDASTDRAGRKSLLCSLLA